MTPVSTVELAAPRKPPQCAVRNRNWPTLVDPMKKSARSGYPVPEPLPESAFHSRCLPQKARCRMNTANRSNVCATSPAFHIPLSTSLAWSSPFPTDYTLLVDSFSKLEISPSRFHGFLPIYLAHILTSILASCLHGSFQLSGTDTAKDARVKSSERPTKSPSSPCGHSDYSYSV